MYIPDKQYTQSVSQENDQLERQRHEEEMLKALERLDRIERRRRKTLLCGIAGFVVGVLYIVYVTLGIEWMDALLTALSGGNGLIRFILDFMPPIVISGIAAYIIARKEKGVITYILSAISVFLVVLLVFLVYVSLMAG